MLLEIFERETGTNQQYLTKIINSASYRYKRYYIKKRNGSLRLIEHPAKEVKALQRIAVKYFLKKLPIHICATAYRTGFGIKQNAEVHLKNRFLLKMDFENFFNSITMRSLEIFFQENNRFAWSSDDITHLTRLICRNSRLTIGAPSSPSASNVFMFKFDELIYAKCEELKVTYTRYADDLTFSCNTPDTLDSVQRLVADSLKILRLPLQINHNKTVFTSKKRLRRVTGLVLTSKNEISVGRDRKRKIRSMFFRLLKNELSLEQVKSLQGELSYIMCVEPTFISSLQRKFGSKYFVGIKTLLAAQNR